MKRPQENGTIRILRSLRNHRVIAVATASALVLIFALSSDGTAAVMGLQTRDFQSNAAATSVSWRASHGTNPYPDVEYDVSRSEQVPGFVYVQGSGAKTIRLTFKSYPISPLSLRLKVDGIRLAVAGTGGTTYTNLSYSGGNQTFTLPALGTASLDVPVTVPGQVDVGQFQALAWVELSGGGSAMWGSKTVWQGWGDLYLVLGTPTNLQATPWLDLLETTCDWARGSSTSLTCTELLTKKLLRRPGWVYRYDTSLWNGTTYNLTAALGSGTRYVNCYDVSGFLHLAFASNGLASQIKELQPVPEQSFTTHKIAPIGSDFEDENSFDCDEWDVHAVLDNGSVYDATIAFKYDLTGALYQEAAFYWSPSDYWQKYNGGWYLGLVMKLSSSQTPEYVSHIGEQFTMTGVY